MRVRALSPEACVFVPLSLVDLLWSVRMRVHASGLVGVLRMCAHACSCPKACACVFVSPNLVGFLKRVRSLVRSLT